LHRTPTRDFNEVANNLGDVLKYLNKPKTEFLIFGDTNTD